MGRRSLFLSLMVLGTFSLFLSCSSTTSSDATGGTGGSAGAAGTGGSASGGLRLRSEADFGRTATQAPGLVMVKATSTGVCGDRSDPTMEDPVVADGEDCDGDGGVVAHLTPSLYAIAFHHVTLVPEDIAGEDAPAIELVSPAATLADSEVIEFSTSEDSQTVVTIDPDDLTEGSYSGIEMGIYYFQMTFPVGGVERNVRFYMSDDDFASEGSLGHHQGDITFIDDEGTELGWVDSTWLIGNVVTTRSDGQNGAGGTDSQTGHDRGFFGNQALWNSTDMNQGADQDIYVTTVDFSEGSLEIPDPSTISSLTTIAATFSVADTFFYEDFPPQNTTEFPGFFPDTGGEATGGEWAPLLPTAILSID